MVKRDVTLYNNQVKTTGQILFAHTSSEFACSKHVNFYEQFIRKNAFMVEKRLIHSVWSGWCTFGRYLCVHVWLSVWCFRIASQCYPEELENTYVMKMGLIRRKRKKDRGIGKILSQGVYVLQLQGDSSHLFQHVCQFK